MKRRPVVYANKLPPCDEPQFNVAANVSWPGRVHFSIGTGRDGYNISPERAEELARQLLAAAAAASGTG